jgi:peptide/nickel transport system substrate-binding protein
MQNADGSTAAVEKVNDTTVKWVFAGPNTTFLLDLANMDGADKSIANLAFAPARYLKQFHPDFVDEAELQAKVTDAGYQTWVELFGVEALPHLSGERPSTAAWVPDGSTVADEVFVIKRNPYYFAVDSEGNQLPYIDEVRFSFFADAQSLNLAAVGGQLDMQGRHIIMNNYPVLVENAEKSGYRVLTWPTFGGSDAVLMLNQTYKNDPDVAEVLRNKDFRIALSHAIDREAIKELAFLGLGEARQGVPAPHHPYYPGDEHAFKYTAHDVDKANALLDGIGLTERDGQGFRLLPMASGSTSRLASCPRSRTGPISGSSWSRTGPRRACAHTSSCASARRTSRCATAAT